MTNEEKAKIILESVDSVYTIPTYLEERVKKEIIAGLEKINKYERKCIL